MASPPLIHALTAAVADDVLDKEIFHAFMELCGNEGKTLLQWHAQDAKNRLCTMRAQLAQKHFHAMTETAHALRSATCQIGMQQATSLAESIEEEAAGARPDAVVLTKLVEDLMNAHAAAMQSIHALIQDD